MNIACNMFTAALTDGYLIQVACEGEEIGTYMTMGEAWGACCAVDCAEVVLIKNNTPREWARIIPELDGDENIADFYAEGWVADWFEENVT
jgi:hypothetical protein